MQNRFKNIFWIALPLLILGYFLLMLRTAWLCDDAFITLRVVDNLIQGWGPRWNIGERVQAFTHPLWALLLSMLVFITHEFYFSVLFFSILISLFAVFIILIIHRREPALVFLMVLVLMLSKAFMDYTTSGLENPLSYLLITAFFYFYWQESPRPGDLGWCAFFAALLLLCRQDYLFLIGPLFAEKLIRVKSERKYLFVFAGFLPLLLWSIGALVYYGSFIPNPAHAKAFGLGLSKFHLAKQGLFYLSASVLGDYVTGCVLLGALVLPLFLRERKIFFTGLGLASYILYIIYIGGDFMKGRFLAVPFYLSVLLMGQVLSRFDVRKIFTLAVLVIILCTAGNQSAATFFTNVKYGISAKSRMPSWEIIDERAFYYQKTGLLRKFSGETIPRGAWVRRGLELNQKPGTYVLEAGIGLTPFYAGPKNYFVDPLGITDPFLARLKPELEGWRIGHFKRKLPDGYFETLTTGKNQILDKEMAGLYDKIFLITRGPLWNAQRWRAILQLLFQMRGFR